MENKVQDFVEMEWSQILNRVLSILPAGLAVEEKLRNTPDDPASIGFK